MGSKSGADEPKLADGISPIEPTRPAAASLKMSPNIFELRITSNCDGLSVNCIAALSTYMCSSFTAGYTALIAVTVRRQSCELVSTLALSTEQSRRERLSAREYANAAMRSISCVEYDSVSQARSTPFSVELPLSPKYIPPASSRTISRSRSPRRSGFNGEIPRSGSSNLTGRTLTKSPRPLRNPSNPLSGRFPTGSASHFGPPTAPRKTASALRQASSVWLGSGVPAASMPTPPIGSSVNSNWWLNSCADSRRTDAAARVTSGPMPSPGRSTMVFFMVVLEWKQNPSRPCASKARWEQPVSAVANSWATERLGYGRRLRRHRRGPPPDHLMCDGDNIPRTYLLGLIGQGGHPVIHFRKFRVACLVAQIAQRQAQRIAARVLAENQGAARHPDGLR